MSQPTPTNQHPHQHNMSLLIPGALMKHCHQASERTQPNKASPSQSSRPTSATSSLLAKIALTRGRESTTTTASTSTTSAPQPAPSASASVNPTPIPTHAQTATPMPMQPQSQGETNAPKPPRTRVPAVTSKSLTTAPLKDKSRPPRRKYPSNMRQRTLN